MKKKERRKAKESNGTPVLKERTEVKTEKNRKGRSGPFSNDQLANNVKV